VSVESDEDERTYAFNNVSQLESAFEEVEAGTMVRMEFEGHSVAEESGLPYQQWEVRPAE